MHKNKKKLTVWIATFSFDKDVDTLVFNKKPTKAQYADALTFDLKDENDRDMFAEAWSNVTFEKHVIAQLP